MDEPSPLEKRFSQYSKYGLPIVILLGAIFAGTRLGPPGVVLVLAGGALIGVITAFWVSVRTLIGETPLSGADAYALGAPAAEEEAKRAVIRALKDIEYERSVGKISEEDYSELKARYRAEVKRLMRQIDETALPRREHVEDLVRKRLQKEGLVDSPEAQTTEPKRDDKPGKKKKQRGLRAKEDAAPIPKRAESDAEDEAAPAKEADDAVAAKPTPKAEAEIAQRTCSMCGTRNDLDAVFCKKCGARQVDEKKDDADAKSDDEAKPEVKPDETKSKEDE